MQISFWLVKVPSWKRRKTSCEFTFCTDTGHLLAKVDNQSLVLYLYTKTFKTTKACRFGIHPSNFSPLILIVMYINKKYDTVFHCKYLSAVSNLMLAQQYLPLSFFANVNDGFISLRKKRKQATQRADIFLE